MSWNFRSFNRRRSALCFILSISLCVWSVSGIADTDPGQSVDANNQSTTAQPVKSQIYPPYLIGPGDLLSVTVYGEKDFPLNYLVDSAGVITFPLVGDVVIAGLTQGQACGLLAKLLSRDLKAPQVTVLIQESNYFTVSVIGAVMKPGRFGIHGIPNILSVLADAGGPAQDADISAAVLIHNNEKKSINLRNFLEGEGVNAPQPLLFPGDVVMVPRSWWSYMNDLAVPVGILASVAAIAATVYTINHNQ